jgi:hypothetical protein
MIKHSGEDEGCVHPVADQIGLTVEAVGMKQFRKFAAE